MICYGCLAICLENTFFCYKQIAMRSIRFAEKRKNKHKQKKRCALFLVYGPAIKKVILDFIKFLRV